MEKAEYAARRRVIETYVGAGVHSLVGGRVGRVLRGGRVSSLDGCCVLCNGDVSSLDGGGVRL